MQRLYIMNRALCISSWHMHEIPRCGEKKVQYRVAGKKEQIAIVSCVNAIGQSIPPMVILEGMYLNHQWTVWGHIGNPLWHERQGVNRPRAVQPLAQETLPQVCIPGRLLLVNSHSSHYEPASIELVQEDVVISSVCPHTPRRSHNPSTALHLVLWSGTVQMPTTSFSSTTLVWWWQSSPSPGFLPNRGKGPHTREHSGWLHKM